MYHIVLGVDKDEEHAAAAAREVTELPGTDEIEVTLVHVFQDNPSGASAGQVGAVREAEDVLTEAGIEVDIAESSGDPADAIIEIADDVDADLVVVGGRKRSPTGKALFGSVTQAVILNAGRPVMVTGVTEEA
ncbi:universal stress protein [Halobaculum sp. D14]|uniref:universal stress protein n=1 Tax=unclassified Halobaculum TaxID=2640896 RepID=UPI003EB8F0F3